MEEQKAALARSDNRKKRQKQSYGVAIQEKTAGA
jgi:hypothetical protein